MICRLRHHHVVHQHTLCRLRSIFQSDLVENEYGHSLCFSKIIPFGQSNCIYLLIRLFKYFQACLIWYIHVLLKLVATSKSRLLELAFPERIFVAQSYFAAKVYSSGWNFISHAHRDMRLEPACLLTLQGLPYMNRLRKRS